MTAPRTEPARSESDVKFATIEEAIQDIRAGKMVLVVDDEDRENEGDFIMAAQFCTAREINIMRRYGSGVICIPTTQKRLEELGVPMMVGTNTSRLGTPMTVTVDGREHTTTGVSAEDRAATVAVFVDPKAKRGDLTRPGHMVPLRAEEGGVLRRTGHTEATVDLCVLAGLYPAGVLCEAMNEDGTMARVPDLVRMGKQFGLKLVTIADLIAYRRRTERLVERVATTKLPTARYGPFTIHAYESKVDPFPAVALVKGEIDPETPTLVRVHSSCVTGDLLDSLRCDCGDQLHMALEKIARAGRGVLVYLQQEGRGIGLINKMRAYELQDGGADTVEANEQLGFKPDLRDYGIGAQILADVGLRKIVLLTNNPAKVRGVQGYGLEITDWMPLTVRPNPHNERYLQTKREKFGHIFSPTDLPPEAGEEPAEG